MPRLLHFKGKHPRCCYCCGSSATESIDHAPPSALFFAGMSRPRELEVPACNRCHSQFAPFDDFVSTLVKMQVSCVSEDQQYGLEPRWRSLRPRFPAALQQWHDTFEDIWVYENGIFKEYCRARVDSEETQFAVAFFTARLVAATYYEKTGNPLPDGSYVSCGWASNSDLEKNDIPQAILDLTDKHDFLKQGRNTSVGQFEYCYKIDGELGVFLYSLHDIMWVWGVLFGVEKGNRHPDRFNFITSPSGLQPVDRPWPTHPRRGSTP